jgi:hypothetical protein
MRRIARVQQRKRQAWLALPASGIDEVSHGSRAERTIGKDCGEAMTLMIHRLHELGPQKSAPLLAPPRHVY